jgi:hypothetical protein
MVDQNDVKLLYEAFFAIAESYTTMIYMDTTDKRAYAIKLDKFSERYKSMLKERPLLKDVFGLYVDEMVSPEDKAELMKLVDSDYVMERLRTESNLLHVYRTVHGDETVYYRLKIVSIEDGKKLVYGFENIDNSYRHQWKIEADRETQMMLFDGLSREYMSVWYLDGKSRKVKLMKNNGTASENGEAVRIGNTMVDYHFSMQKYFGDFVSPEEFDRLMEETSYENLCRKVGDRDLYCVNYIRNNPDGSRAHFQVCYAKMSDSTGIAKFVMGFRMIDIAE